MFNYGINQPLEVLDSYKIGHADQYPKGTQQLFLNLTPRSFKHLNSQLPQSNQVEEMTFVGLQAFLTEFQRYWNENFFYKPVEEAVESYLTTIQPFLGSNTPEADEKRADRIRKLHAVGYLPLEIRALPEGSRVPEKVPVAVFFNTREEFYFCSSLETFISSELWKASTSATIASAYNQMLNRYADITCDDRSFVPWQAHDFSMRGMSNVADAAMSGLGHLVYSLGTDNVPATILARNYYTTPESNTFIGGSVDATEHTVMMVGKQECEEDTFRRLITDVYPNGIVSIVSDTWNFWEVVTPRGGLARRLKNEILNRGPNALGLSKVVFRPDSGNPVDIVCGTRAAIVEETVYEYIGIFENVEQFEQTYLSLWDEDDREVTKQRLFEQGVEWDEDDIENLNFVGIVQLGDGEMGIIGVNAYENKVLTFQHYEVMPNETNSSYEFEELFGALGCLALVFGGTFNSKGYFQLNPKVGLIYGDSITPKVCDEILYEMASYGFASNNMVFGIGSYTYQHQTRDTLGFAIKATAAIVDGELVETCKSPYTDGGTKKSALGYLRVDEVDGKLVMTDGIKPDVIGQVPDTGLLKTVFKNGCMVGEKQTLDSIRARASKTS